MCLYSAMQNHRAHACIILTHKQRLYFISAAAHCLRLSLMMQNKPLSLALLILDPLFLPAPSATLLSLSPLCPIMDFSRDVRKKYLLLECIDCFNGREQRARREKKWGPETQRSAHRSPLA